MTRHEPATGDFEGNFSLLKRGGGQDPSERGMLRGVDA